MSQVRIFKEDAEWLKAKAKGNFTVIAVVIHDLISKVKLIESVEEEYEHDY